MAHNSGDATENGRLAAVIEQWPVNRLVPYARNPRRNDHAVGQMVSSIKEFGFKIPILARSDGTIVDGHLRLKAANVLELKEVPVISCDEWTEAQVKAFRLMVNRSVSWAEWDEEVLGLELEELKRLDFNLNLTGFGGDEIEKFLNGLAVASPSSFGEYDENIQTEHQCPKCGYRWSGQSSSGNLAQELAPQNAFVPDLAFPNGEHVPAETPEVPAVFSVAPNVPVEFASPELDVTGGLGTGEAAAVPMPKTAVDEDHRAPARKNDVGRSGKRANGKPKAKAEAVQKGADELFGPRVAAADARHQGAALGGGKRVNHA